MLYVYYYKCYDIPLGLCVKRLSRVTFSFREVCPGTEELQNTCDASKTLHYKMLIKQGKPFFFEKSLFEKLYLQKFHIFD